MNENLKQRILKGIEYFENIEPSSWNAAHAHHAKVLHSLMKDYLKEKNEVEEVKEVFGI